MTLRILLGMLVLMFSLGGATRLHGQNSVVTYQGRVTSGSNAFTGAGQFKFALVTSTNDSLTFTTFWSNDGTSVAGSEPTAAVSVNVADGGLFTVPLGDTALANMMALSTTLFQQTNLQLRIWFNDGVNGFAALSPVQPLTFAPYAAFAQFSQSASNLLGKLSATQLTGAVPLANLPTTALVTNGQTGVNLTGNFSGNGAGVTNLNLSLNSGGAICGSGSFMFFSSPSVGGVGSEIYSVTAADVNGDGKLDLISADFGNSTLTVLINNGNGVFALSSTLGVGSRPLTVTTADIDGDGKPDLISANSVSDTLTVLTNTGSGSFALSSSPGVGDNPQSVTATDVNGDGKLDLISANSLSATLTVLTNNGSGGFATSSSPGVGSFPASVTSADVNGDAKVDLISVNSSGGGTLTVLTNNGSGAFTIFSSPSVGSFPVSVTAADVNGDGKMDLISANNGGNTLTVLTNNGSGSFALASAPGVGNRPRSVAAADVNGDGKVDLISANELSATLTVLLNNGSGGFALSSSPSVGDFPKSVIAADVNGDGKQDLISASFADSTLTVLLNGLQFTGNFVGNLAGSFPNGNVGIGTIAPQVPLHIVSDPQAVMVLQDTGDNSTQSGYVGFWNATTETAWVGFGTPGSPDFSIVNARPGGNIVLSALAGKVGVSRSPTANRFEVEGNASKTAAGSWIANSDARIKTGVRSVTNALDKLAQVRLVEFHYTEDYRAQHPSIENRSYLNVIAQEFQQVFPENVQSSGEKIPGGGDEILQVDTYPLTIYSAAAIQELNRKLETGSQRSMDRIQKLEAENAELKKSVAELKELIGRIAARRSMEATR